MKNASIKVLFTILLIFPFGLFAQNKGQMIERAPTKAPVWLGVRLHPDLAGQPGARVSGVLRNSPSDGAGLLPGDRIIGFENRKIANAASLQKITKQYRDGDKIEITFLRTAKSRKAKITLRSMPGEETIVRQHLIGEKAPTLTFKTKGQMTNLSSTTGKITVIDFWATWCRPCRETDKQLQKTAKRFGDKVSILSISTESEKRVNAFMKKHPKPGVIVGIDHQNISETLWHISTYPTVVLLDQKQNIVSVMFGVKEVNLLNARIEKLLQK